MPSVTDSGAAAKAPAAEDRAVEAEVLELLSVAELLVLELLELELLLEEELLAAALTSPESLSCRTRRSSMELCGISAPRRKPHLASASVMGLLIVRSSPASFFKRRSSRIAIRRRIRSSDAHVRAVVEV
jgi:hypothetical protein